MPTVIYDLPLITIAVSNYHLFSDINISQCNVAMRLRCGALVIYHFTANLSQSLTMKEFWKSVKIWQSYRHEFGGPIFFGTQCTISGHSCKELEVVASFCTKNLNVKWLDEARIEALACACKFSLLRLHIVHLRDCWNRFLSQVGSLIALKTVSPWLHWKMITRPTECVHQSSVASVGRTFPSYTWWENLRYMPQTSA